MSKKLFLAIGLAIAIIFSFSVTLSFATENTMQNAGNDVVNGVRDVVGGAENAVEGTAGRSVRHSVRCAQSGKVCRSADRCSKVPGLASSFRRTGKYSRGTLAFGIETVRSGKAD